MDRFDIFCWVGAVKYEDLISPTQETDFATKQNIENARKRQRQRFESQHILTNAEMRLPEIKKHCQIDSNSENILKRFVDSSKLSARGFHRVLKVARTIADLDEREGIALQDVTEALNYRMKQANNQ